MEKGWGCGGCFCGGWFADRPWGCQMLRLQVRRRIWRVGNWRPKMSVVYLVRLEFNPTHHLATGCSRQNWSWRTKSWVGMSWTWLDPAMQSVFVVWSLRSRVPPRRVTFSDMRFTSHQPIAHTPWFYRFKQIRIARELMIYHDHLFELSPSHREVVQPMNICGWWFQHVWSSFRKGLPFNMSQIIRSFGASVQVTSFSFLALLCADMMFTDVDAGATSARHRFGSLLWLVQCACMFAMFNRFQPLGWDVWYIVYIYIYIISLSIYSCIFGFRFFSDQKEALYDGNMTLPHGFPKMKPWPTVKDLFHHHLGEQRVELCPIFANDPGNMCSSFSLLVTIPVETLV